jgi:drug/metabolite transporter (DMT)-like permease
VARWRPDQDILIAVVLALISALAFALSTVMQQRGTYQVPNVSLGNPRSLLQLVARPVWLVAFGVMVVGWAFQAAALDHGRVSIVQVFLTMTLVFVLPLGVWLTGQHVAKREILAAVVIVVGLSVFAKVGNPANGRSDAPSAAWLTATIVVMVICGAVLAISNHGGPSFRAAANGTVSGATAGLLAVMAKPVLAELHSGLSAVFADPKTYMVGILAVLGVVFQQFGLATGKLAPTVASGSVASPIVAVALGAALLEERLARPEWHVVVALGALGIALAAAVVIATAPHGDTGDALREPAGETAA